MTRGQLPKNTDLLVQYVSEGLCTEVLRGGGGERGWLVYIRWGTAYEGEEGGGDGGWSLSGNYDQFKKTNLRLDNNNRNLPF